MTTPPPKTAFRTAARLARKSLSPQQRSAASQNATFNLLTWLAAKPQIQTIASYAHFASELNTDDLNQALLDSGFKLLLPRMRASGKMDFYPCQDLGKLHTNRSGIRQPLQTRALPKSKIDLVIVPMLAFDDTGTRLGNGGGFYDRYLSKHARRPLRLGFAFEAQKSATALPRETHDVPLHWLVTDSRVQSFL